MLQATVFDADICKWYRAVTRFVCAHVQSEKPRGQHREFPERHCQSYLGLHGMRAFLNGTVDSSIFVIRQHVWQAIVRMQSSLICNQASNATRQANDGCAWVCPSTVTVLENRANWNGTVKMYGTSNVPLFLPSQIVHESTLATKNVEFGQISPLSIMMSAISSMISALYSSVSK